MTKELLKNNFGKIGILFGGPSSEREISLKSGNAVVEALRNANLNAVGIDIKTDNEQEVKSLVKDSGISVAFIALHGKFGEDGGIQEILDDMRIPYTGSGVIASRLAMDKIASRKIFESNNIPVPGSSVFVSMREVESFAKKHEFNGSVFVVKPSSQGSSVGVFFVDNRDALLKASNDALKYDGKIIIEDYLKGRELTVGILEDKPLPVVEILPKKQFFDFQAKYEKGMTDYDVPAKLPQDIAQKAQATGLKAHKSLGCHCFSRVDIILKDNTPYVLEVNSIPGLTATSLLPKAAKVVNIDFLGLCLRIIRDAYAKKKA
ncbi:MAG: D-alanine--D-alanine ligase [Candidatus Omnitrophica bacterium]|nr:D-alanine--D-alanine ligase [Candidatus Omnitrophota bacterium]HOX55191.1 D-alanine--D-alanine ligase [Candidatus Omnitrophota bacterium]